MDVAIARAAAIPRVVSYAAAVAVPAMAAASAALRALRSEKYHNPTSVPSAVMLSSATADAPNIALVTPLRLSARRRGIWLLAGRIVMPLDLRRTRKRASLI